MESTTQKPKTWKCYVDDSVTILDRSYVDCLLQHLNSQQPTIRFTMETEKDNKIVFLHLSVTPPVSTENQLRQISTQRMIHTTLNK